VTEDPSLLTIINPLNAELNPICHLLALAGAHHFVDVSRIRFKTCAGNHGYVFQNFSMTEEINIVIGFPKAWSIVSPLNLLGL
jgi:hypothetical protein